MSAVLLPPSALETHPDRIRSSLLYVLKDSFTSDAVFQTKFTTLPGVKRIDLLEVAIRGIPVTSGRADYPWYQITFDNIRVHSSTTQSKAGRLIIPLIGEDKEQSFGDTYTLVQSEVPMDLTDFEVTISKPDGSIVGSTEIDSIVLTLRVYQDLYRGREAHVPALLG